MHTIKTDADKARAIANVATALQERLIISEGRWTTGAQYSLLHLCNAVIDLIDDGDCLRERDILMGELRCDEEGNPLPPEPSDLVRMPSGYELRAALNPIATVGDVQ